MVSFTLKVEGGDVLIRIPDSLCMALCLAGILTGKTLRAVATEALEKYDYRTDKAKQLAIARHVFHLIKKVKRGKLKLV